MDSGFSVLHFSDPHFGPDVDVAQIEALEALVPDLEPQLVVLSGDITHRAMHGEFQRAQAFVRELGRTAPVYVTPGEHDVQWWKRPLIPFGRSAKYEKFATYFNPVLAPTIETPDAIVTGVVTAHGLAWGSLGFSPGEWAVKGHISGREIKKVQETFGRADESKTRILVMHHNLLRGKVSKRNGLMRSGRALEKVLNSGVDIVLCGHDHHDQVDLVHGVTVVATGTVSSKTRFGRPAGFHRISFDDTGVRVELYRWESTRRIYHRSDVYTFARRRVIDEEISGIAAS
jgi:3',5'-cyclic AMP phosphodiesterase CpdA